MKRFLLILLFFTGCSSSTINFTPSPEQDPMEINFTFAALSRILTQQYYLHHAPLPVDLRIEKMIIDSPFPYNTTCEENYPVIKKFQYPTNDPGIKSINILIYITLPSPLTILEASGEIKYKNGEKRNFVINEYGNERDGNILTGSVILRESITYPSEAITNTTNITSIFTRNNNGVTPVSQNIYLSFKDDRESFISIKFSDDHKKISMNRYNKINKPFQFTVEEEINWIEETLEKEQIRINGKDFLWNESITRTSEKWRWSINEGKTGEGYMDENSVWISLYTGEKICLNRKEKCSVSFTKKGKKVIMTTGNIYGEGSINESTTLVTFTVKDLTGTYIAHLYGETDKSGIEILYYYRDLSLTGIQKDEQGKGIIITPFVFSLEWEKNWFSGKTSFTLLFHYSAFSFTEF